MMRRSGQAAQGGQSSWLGFVGLGSRQPLRSERRARGDEGPGRRLVRAASLSGAPVVTREGDLVGNVSELMLDVERGRIAYAVVAYGGFMGLGERLHPIPWRALALDAERDCLVLDASRTTFLESTGFDKDHWPDAPHAEWHHELHRHYGCPPYWD